MHTDDIKIYAKNKKVFAYFHMNIMSNFIMLSLYSVGVIGQPDPNSCSHRLYIGFDPFLYHVCQIVSS